MVSAIAPSIVDSCSRTSSNDTVGAFSSVASRGVGPAERFVTRKSTKSRTSRRVSGGRRSRSRTMSFFSVSSLIADICVSDEEGRRVLRGNFPYAGAPCSFDETACNVPRSRIKGVPRTQPASPREAVPERVRGRAGGPLSADRSVRIELGRAHFCCRSGAVQIRPAWRALQRLTAVPAIDYGFFRF